CGLHRLGILDGQHRAGTDVSPTRQGFRCDLDRRKGRWGVERHLDQADAGRNQHIADGNDIRRGDATENGDDLTVIGHWARAAFNPAMVASVASSAKLSTPICLRAAPYRRPNLADPINGTAWPF